MSERELEALRDIQRHRQMPAGESWERAYNEVCDIADAALATPESREEGDADAAGDSAQREHATEGPSCTCPGGYSPNCPVHGRSLPEPDSEVGAAEEKTDRTTRSEPKGAGGPDLAAETRAKRCPTCHLTRSPSSWWTRRTGTDWRPCLNEFHTPTEEEK